MPQTRLERNLLLGGVFVAFLLVLIGYMFFIGPQRSQTSDVTAQRASAQQANVALKTRIGSLQQESRNLATYQAQVTRAQLALPSTSGLPDFLRTLQSIGDATLAGVSALTVGPPTDVTVVSSGTPAASAKPAAHPHAAAASTRVYALPITASVSGTAAQLDQFLTQLQVVQPRAVLISQLTEGSGGTTGQSGGTTLQLTMQAFVAPASAAEQAQLSAASGK
jgi:Tfp pilus assembly protein PilO